MLISLHLASNNASRLGGLFDNLEKTSLNPSDIEVLVKVDLEDKSMLGYVAEEAQLRRLNIRHIATPRLDGYSSLWRAYNDLISICDPAAYFVALITDEFRFTTKLWDQELSNYIGFFPDHVFRLRISEHKLRNYFSVWECGYAPDSYAIFTKRWFDISGDWNACNTPDAFQQMVMFFLYKSTFPSTNNRQYSRDIPIWNIKISGETPYQGLSEEQLKVRVKKAKEDWRILISFNIQLEALHRAHRLKAYFFATEMALSNYSIESDRERRLVVLRDRDTDIIIAKFYYRLNRLKIEAENAWKMLFHDYYCGGNLDILIFIYRQKIGWTCDYFRGFFAGVRQKIVHLRQRERVAFQNVRGSMFLCFLILITGVGAVWILKCYLEMYSRKFVGDLSALFVGKLMKKKIIKVHSNSESSPNLAHKLLKIDEGFWGSLENTDDVFVYLQCDEGFKPYGLELMIFAPSNRCHIRDISVIGTTENKKKVDTLKHTVIPSRVKGKEKAFKKKITIPNSPDKEIITIELSPKVVDRKIFYTIGISCFSGSRHYSRNYLLNGFGIYLRHIRVLEL